MRATRSFATLLIILLRGGIASESRQGIAVCHRNPLILTRFPCPLRNSTNVNTIDAPTKRRHSAAKGPVHDLAVFFLPTVPRSAIAVTGTRTESSCTKGAIPLQASPPAVHWLVNGFELRTIRPSATTQPVVFRVCTVYRNRAKEKTRRRKRRDRDERSGNRARMNGIRRVNSLFSLQGCARSVRF